MSLIKTALVLDVNNLYFAAKLKFGGQRKLRLLDYANYIEKQLGCTITYKIAYSRQDPNSCTSFIGLLKSSGFECHFGNSTWSIAMALRAAEIVANVDCFVLGTNYIEAGRILAYAKDKGKLTKCFAINIPPLFKQYADCLEIPEELLSEAPVPTE